MWERTERSLRVQEFTFPGDPMRFDYGYWHNGMRGFVQLLSVAEDKPENGERHCSPLKHFMSSCG